MTVLLTGGSEGFLGLLALSGQERNANINRSHLNGPVNRKASVWVGGMKTFWRSETRNLEDSTFEKRTGAKRPNEGSCEGLTESCKWHCSR